MDHRTPKMTSQPASQLAGGQHGRRLAGQDLDQAVIDGDQLPGLLMPLEQLHQGGLQLGRRLRNLLRKGDRVQGGQFHASRLANEGKRKPLPLHEALGRTLHTPQLGDAVLKRSPSVLADAAVRCRKANFLQRR